MKKDLYDLYKEYFIIDEKSIQDKEILNFSTPFLLDINESYLTGKHKVMIIGQETYEWYGQYRNFLKCEFPIDYAQSVYANFLKTEALNYNSPFWNYLNNLFEGSCSSWLWNNVFKMETVEYLSNSKYLGKKVSLSLLNQNKEYRHLIDKIKSTQKDIFIKEISILKPDIMIFFTGNPYDSLFLDWQFDTENDFYQDIPEAISIGLDRWKFGKLNCPYLPEKTFRTYHPNYLRRASNKIISHEQKEFIFNFLKAQIVN